MKKQVIDFGFWMTLFKDYLEILHGVEFTNPWNGLAYALYSRGHNPSRAASLFVGE